MRAFGEQGAIRRLRLLLRNTLLRLTSEVHRWGTVPGLLSIVVPVYNVEEYLDECLVSLRFQHYPKIEIIVVDDGSPDGSVAIARRHQLRDPRIRIVRRPNGGLSAARNTGVAAARGEFLAFADSDDTVPAGGYRAAVQSLAQTGSDFAVLPFQRIVGALISPPAPWIRSAHREQRLAITVEDYPEIQVNVIMCSKVFRREFWDRLDLSFPEGLIYEDQLVAPEAYARARAFDVLTVPIYNWRHRTGSISVRPREVANLRARLSAAGESIRVLRQYGSAVAVAERLVQLLSNDIPQFTSRLPGADQAFWELLRDGLPTLVGQLDREVYLARVPAQHKVLNHLIMTDQRAAAEQFIRSGKLGITRARVGEEEVGYVAYLPFWRDPATAVPDGCFRISDTQARAECSIRRVRTLAPATVQVEAWAFLRNIDLSDRDLQVLAWARAPGHDDVPLPVEQRFDQAIDELEVGGGSGYCDYRRGGVVITIDTRALAAGTWKVLLELTAGPRSGSVIAWNPWPFGTGMLRLPVSAGEGRAAVASAARWGHFQLEVFDRDLVAEQAVVQDGEVRLQLRGAIPRRIELQSAGRQPIAGRPGPVSPDGVWAVAFPVPPARPGSEASVTCWEVRATSKGRQVPVRFGPAVPWEQESSGLPGWRAGVGQTSELELRASQWAAQVVGAEIDDSGIALRLRTHGLDIAGFQAVFESSRTVSYGVAEPGPDGAVTVRLPMLEERWGEEGQLLLSGTYHFSLVHRATGQTLLPLAAPGFLGELPQDVLTTQARVQLQLRQNEPLAVSVVVSGPVPVPDRGLRNQFRLQQVASQGKADERAVFFRSLYGEVANDNGLAIHHELRRRNADLTLYWSVEDLAVPVPEGAVRLVEGTAEWYQRLGAAQYVVVNLHQPDWYSKPPGQVMVQTFHGYPYKGMGKAWWEFTDLPANRITSFLDRAADWDYLVSPASYATPALLEAFFTPEAASRVTVVEAGYPRNDILLSGEGGKVRNRVRAALGIGEGQKAVLYAPTFRDYLSQDGMTAKVASFFNPLAAASALGPDYVLLVRGHAFNARGNAERVKGENIRDVTYYPDVMDLCLASDAAILDYSSLRFDYALMQKPMIFLVPDKASYHALRPAIMPYDPTAPGPHVRSTEEAVAHLRDLDGVGRRYRPAIGTLISTYMELEDGHASERVVDAVFGPLRPAGG
ncbi:MAG: CDP-glycerol glycerophosphotransferase family protein [Gemmatimonadota bacterium]